MTKSNASIDFIRQNIGAKIKARRLALGFGLNRVSQGTGIDKHTLISLEKGDNVSVTSLIKILKYLDGELEIKFALTD